MPKASHLLNIAVFLLLAAMGLGVLMLIDPTIFRLPEIWFVIINWTTALVWISALIVLFTSAISFAVGRLRGSPDTPSVQVPLTSRFAIAFSASWIFALPHAYLAMPHYKMSVLLYIAGIEAYATGNAIAAFIVCSIILLLARRRSNLALILSLAAAVIINASFVFEYVNIRHRIG